MDFLDLLTRGLGLRPDECAGKTAVVTGAGRGIGFQTARAVARLGGKVVIAEISPAGSEAEAAIRAEGGQARFLPTDVSDAESVARLAQDSRAIFGPVDLLINNAIRCPAVSTVDMDVRVWDAVIATNLRGTFLTCRAFLPEMLARKRGVILNMVSTDAMPGLAAYIASKQGIIGFSQSLALETGPSGVNVIPFSPGMVDTPAIREIAQDLAPRLGLTEAQFLNLSLHAGYDGLMPPEHAGAATVYLGLRLAETYHGQVVNGYEVLERAGLLQPGQVVPAAPDTAPPPAQQTANPAALLALVQQIQAILVETGQEFEKLPVFVRPIARSGFKNKTGASLDGWQRMLERFSSTVCDGQPAHSPSICPALQKLAAYYQDVPGETARFTRDQALLTEVTRVSQERIRVIRALVAALS